MAMPVKVEFRSRRLYTKARGNNLRFSNSECKSIAGNYFLEIHTHMVKNMMYITSEIKPEVAGGSNRHSPQCKLGETMVEISFQKHEEKPHL